MPTVISFHFPLTQDYELLEEATGIRRQRPAQQHRRIKKARDAEGGGAAQQDAARALQVRVGRWRGSCVLQAAAGAAGMLHLEDISDGVPGPQNSSWQQPGSMLSDR